MDIKWQDVITSIGTAVGGGAVLLGAAAWLSKQIVTHKLTQDVEVFKTRLQTEANTEIEKLKASLQLTTLEHQVRFAKLHEKRAEVIAEVYKMLVDLLVKARKVSLEASRSSLEDYENVRTASEKFFDHVQQNRLYLPEPVCISLETLGHELTIQVVHFHLPDGIPQETKLKKFLAFLQEEINRAKRELEDEFRGLLGGSKPPH